MATIIKSDFFWDVMKDGTPAEEGARLAQALLAKGDTDWDDLTIDYRGMSIELHSMFFFYGFLQEIATRAPAVLERARKVKWMLSYETFESLVEAYMTGFVPRAARAAA